MNLLVACILALALGEGSCAEDEGTCLLQTSFLRRPRVTLFSFVTPNRMDELKLPAETVDCYARARGYKLQRVDHASQRCQLHDIFMQKQCEARALLDELPDGEIVVVLDGDTGVLNVSHAIEQYAVADVVFYERFHNGEVMAGNYILRNGDYARRYMDRWLAFDSVLEQQGGFLNHDNGALHPLLAETAAEARGSQDSTCRSAWLRSRDLSSYDSMVGLCKGIMYKGSESGDGFRRLAGGKIVIIDRANAFAVDAWAVETKVSPRSFMQHAMKQAANFDTEKFGHYVSFLGLTFSVASVDHCVFTYKPGVQVSEEEMAKIVLARDAKFQKDRPLSVLAPLSTSRILPSCAHLCFTMHGQQLF